MLWLVPIQLFDNISHRKSLTIQFMNHFFTLLGEQRNKIRLHANTKWVNAVSKVAYTVLWLIERFKGKSPVVPFHGITSPYSYFEEIWIFAPIQQEAKHDQEKISAELNWKVCWQSPAMFCLFTHQAKIQICCRVKLIPWNVLS